MGFLQTLQQEVGAVGAVSIKCPDSQKTKAWSLNRARSFCEKRASTQASYEDEVKQSRCREGKMQQRADADGRAWVQRK